MTTAKVSDRGRITLPAFVRRILGLELADAVTFVQTGPTQFVMQIPEGRDPKEYWEGVTPEQLIRGMQRALRSQVVKTR